MKPLTAIDFIDAADDRVLRDLINLEGLEVWPWAWTLKLPPDNERDHEDFTEL
jgi:hypothetical protein